MLTAASRLRLQTELQRLVAVERPAIAHATVSSEGLGDAADIATRTEMLMDLERLDRRVAHLEALLADDALPHRDHDTDSWRRQLVTLRFDGSGEDERFLIGAVDEREPNLEVVTPDSPLGRALVGAEAGARVTYSPRPGAAPLTVEVVDVAAG